MFFLLHNSRPADDPVHLHPRYYISNQNTRGFCPPPPPPDLSPFLRSFLGPPPGTPKSEILAKNPDFPENPTPRGYPGVKYDEVYAMVKGR